MCFYPRDTRRLFSTRHIIRQIGPPTEGPYAPLCARRGDRRTSMPHVGMANRSRVLPVPDFCLSSSCPRASPSRQAVAVCFGALFCRTGFRGQGSGFRVRGSGFRVQGSGCRVQGSGLRVQGSGFSIEPYRGISSRIWVHSCRARSAQRIQSSPESDSAGARFQAKVFQIFQAVAFSLDSGPET